MFYKPEIRRRLRAERRHLDLQSIEQASKRAAAQLISFSTFIESERIAFYSPEENELDPKFIIKCASDLNKILFLPVIAQSTKNKILDFYSYQSGDTLHKNHHGIAEPNIEKQIKIDAATLDIIFVPLVGFDPFCNRLGRGAGYYDRTLGAIKSSALNKKPTLIGLGYEFQKISQIFPNKWDVPLDFIVTEQTIYRR